MNCSVDGCETRSLAKGLCNKHYKRMTIYGDPLFTTNRGNGEGTPHNSGYWKISVNRRRALRHVLIAEKVLGKRLPKGAEVHHTDENRGNDSYSNLVICQDRSYHRLLHSRKTALRESGHVDWGQCRFCKQYGPASDMARKWFHRHCFNKSQQERRTA